MSDQNSEHSRVREYLYPIFIAVLTAGFVALSLLLFLTYQRLTEQETKQADMFARLNQLIDEQSITQQKINLLGSEIDVLSNGFMKVRSASEPTSSVNPNYTEEPSHMSAEAPDQNGLHSPTNQVVVSTAEGVLKAKLEAACAITLTQSNVTTIANRSECQKEFKSQLKLVTSVPQLSDYATSLFEFAKQNGFSTF